MESIKKSKSSKLKTLKRTCVLGALLLVFASYAQAQTWDEWWSQKKTQIRYLVQQIAELETYGSFLKQGYNIAGKGLGNISGFTGSEFGLHQEYYASLKAVNPAIKDNPEAAAIVQYLSVIPGQFDHLNSLSGLSEDNRKYIIRVSQKVLTECDADIADLQLVMTSGEAEMTDDERIKRLGEIYTRVKDKYAFTLSFCNKVKTLLLQKTQEQQSLQTLKNYYGIN
jgi:hypothetical protein